jgi:hypothetical protein
MKYLYLFVWPDSYKTFLAVIYNVGVISLVVLSILIFESKALSLSLASKDINTLAYHVQKVNYSQKCFIVSGDDAQA